MPHEIYMWGSMFNPEKSSKEKKMSLWLFSSRNTKSPQFCSLLLFLSVLTVCVPTGYHTTKLPWQLPVGQMRLSNKTEWKYCHGSRTAVQRQERVWSSSWDAAGAFFFDKVSEQGLGFSWHCSPWCCVSSLWNWRIPQFLYLGKGKRVKLPEALLATCFIV